ncbi:MAG: FG-GAP-like repeat-containing protein [Blastocatellia bacterium]
MTYMGGAENDDARGIAVDKDGNAYLTGSTSSRNFPTAMPFQAANGGGSDAFVAKINLAGSALVYSTYFGGNVTDTGRGIAVNDAGQVFITGSTSSPNLPVKNPLLPAFGGINDAFVAKFNATGSALEYATWLGGTGNDNGLAIAIDGAGNAYVTGDTASANFPLVDAPQTQLKGTDAFVAKLNPLGSTLLYSTFLGGNSTEAGNAIAVDSTGSAYVAGNTSSTNFPTVNPLRPNPGNAPDGFIVKLGVETDLAIVKTASRNPVLVNNNFSYTLTATNNGPSPATGVIVADQLPAGANFVSATASQGSCANNAGTVTCNIGNLAAQGNATITLTVTPTVMGLITNLASVRGNETDSNQSNNQTLLQITISNRPSIYGRVTLANGNPLAGITLSLTGALTGTQQSNSQGFYQFANLPPSGNYTVTPVTAGYSYEPAVRDFNMLNSDQAADFIATPCSYALTPTNQSFEANGGGGTITVTATARCPWMAATTSSWIKITSGASGAGNGMIAFTVDPTQTPRAGRITVADQSFLIWQGVNVCNDLKFRPRSYYVYGFPNVLFADDLNGDGLTDLIVSQSEAEFDQAQQRFAFPLTIYYGEANGRLTLGPHIFATNVNQPRAIAIGDFNGDGRKDLAVSPGNETDARLLLSNGSGGFTSGGNIRISPLNTFDYAGELRAFDVNKDGKLDLIGLASQKVLVVLNTSSGNNVSFAAPIAVSFEGQSFRGLADVNGDGVADLLTLSNVFPGGPSLSVYLGDGLGSFRQPISSPLTAQVIQTAFADFNADGNVDIAATVIASTPQGDRQKVALLYGDGAGRFGQLTTYDPLLINPSGQEVKLAVRDVNNDARPDVLVLGDRKVRAVLTNGEGKPGSAVEVGSTDDFDLSAFAIGNFDSGGRPDFVTIDGRRSSIVVHWNRCAASGLTVSGQVLDRMTPIGFGDVTVKLTGAQTATVTTDSGGNYEFTGLAPGNYTVMVERGAVEFNPASQMLNNLTTDQIVNFSGQRKGTAVSAASFAGQSLAPDSIASIFGLEMSRTTEIAREQPLPILLANKYVNIKDAAGVERSSQLFFVSPGQINFLIPPDTAIGPATLRVYSPANPTEAETTGTLLIEKVAPGLFTANANGAGVAAAVVFRIKADGTQSYEPVSRFDGAMSVSVPIDLGPATDQVFLLLFGTGIRNNSGLAGVTARIGGEAAEVSYAGPQGGFAGLDQLNVRLPRSLAGRGEVDVMLTVDGKQTNIVRVNIK